MTQRRTADPRGKAPTFSAPKRSLGQNFLADANIARKIVDALDIRPGDSVLEIGPGRGALSRLIRAREPGRFRLLEKDDALAERLRGEMPEAEVEQGDALRYPWESLPAAEGWKIIGNLPYNIASPLIWDVASRGNFARAVFLVQLEVGRRLASPPGSREYGALSVWVQSYADVKLLFKVPPQVFIPKPKVTSVLAQLVLHTRRPEPEAAAALAATLRLCFQQRRKQLGNILRSKGIHEYEKCVTDCGIDPSARPETLAPERFQALSKSLSAYFPA